MDLEQSQENPDPSQENILASDVYNTDWSDHPFEPGTPGPTISQQDDEETGCPDLGDDEDSYKSMDPHEPSNLKIKPYKRVKGFARRVIGAPKKKTLHLYFLRQRLTVLLVPNYKKSFEVHMSQHENSHASQSVPLYEKLSMSFETEKKISWPSETRKDDNQPDIDVHDSDSNDESDMRTYDMETDSPRYLEKNVNIPTTQESPVGKSSDEKSFADLCRHLDLLLASIAEAEQQTELDARVSKMERTNRACLGKAG